MGVIALVAKAPKGWLDKERWVEVRRFRETLKLLCLAPCLRNRPRITDPYSSLVTMWYNATRGLNLDSKKLTTSHEGIKIRSENIAQDVRDVLTGLIQCEGRGDAATLKMRIGLGSIGYRTDIAITGMDELLVQLSAVHTTPDNPKRSADSNESNSSTPVPTKDNTDKTVRLPKSPDLMQSDGLTVPCFVGREELLKDIEKWIDEGPEPYCLIQAPAGRGKSTFAGIVLRYITTNRSKDIASAFVPIDLRTGQNDQRTVLDRFVATLNAIYCDLPDSLPRAEHSCRETSRRLLTKPPPRHKRLVVIIDGLDEENDYIQWRGMFPDVPQPHLRIIALARPADKFGTPWEQRFGWDQYTLPGYRNFDLPPLNENHIKDAVGRVVPRVDEHYRVELSAELYRLTDGEPFILGLYLKELEGLDVALPGHFARLLTSWRGERKGFSSYFDRWWADHRRLRGGAIPENNVYKVLNFLALSKGPLSLGDFYGMIGVHAQTNHLRDILHDIGRFTTETNEGFCFQNSFLKEYFTGLLSPQEIRDLNQQYAEYARRILHEEDQGTKGEALTPYFAKHATEHLIQVGLSLSDTRALLAPPWLKRIMHESPGLECLGRDLSHIARFMRNSSGNSIGTDFEYAEWLPLMARCYTRLGQQCDHNWMLHDEIIVALYEIGYWPLSQCIMSSDWSWSRRTAELAVRLACAARPLDHAEGRFVLENGARILDRCPDPFVHANIAVGWMRYGEEDKCLNILKEMLPCRHQCLAAMRASRIAAADSSKRHLFKLAVQWCRKVSSIAEQAVCLGVIHRHSDDPVLRRQIEAEIRKLGRSMRIPSVDRIAVFAEIMLCCRNAAEKARVRRKIMDDVDSLANSGKLADSPAGQIYSTTNTDRISLLFMFHDPWGGYEVHSGIQEYYALLQDISETVCQRNNSSDFQAQSQLTTCYVKMIAKVQDVVGMCGKKFARFPVSVLSEIDDEIDRALVCIEASRHVPDTLTRKQLIMHAASLAPGKEDDLPVARVAALASLLSRKNRRVYWQNIALAGVKPREYREAYTAICLAREDDCRKQIEVAINILPDAMQVIAHKLILARRSLSVAPSQVVEVLLGEEDAWLIDRKIASICESMVCSKQADEAPAYMHCRLVGLSRRRQTQEQLQHLLLEELSIGYSDDAWLKIVEQAISASAVISPSLLHAVEQCKTQRSARVLSDAREKIVALASWDADIVRIKNSGTPRDICGTWLRAWSLVKQNDITEVLLGCDMKVRRATVSAILDWTSSFGRGDALSALERLMPIFKAIDTDVDEIIENVLDEVVNVHRDILPRISGRLYSGRHRVPWITSGW